MIKKSNITVDQLKRSFPYINDESKYNYLHQLIHEVVPIEQLEAFTDCINHIQQCYSKPSPFDLTMIAINQLLEGHGIEAIKTKDDEHINSYWMDTKALYVNMGDQYHDTIIYETESGEFFICSWNDYMEMNELTD